jgi:symplekin
LLGPPSGGLVERVRELYKHNPSDVRFLIPVLHGLHKNEVLAALPYFIKLSPNLVRGVFDRLLLSFRGKITYTFVYYPIRSYK